MRCYLVWETKNGGPPSDHPCFQVCIHLGLGGTAANVANAANAANAANDDTQRGRQLNDPRRKALYAAKTKTETKNEERGQVHFLPPRMQASDTGRRRWLFRAAVRRDIPSMARLPPLDLPNIPQHIVQRGNNRPPCFPHDEDRQRYLQLLHEALLSNGCALHACVPDEQSRAFIGYPRR